MLAENTRVRGREVRRCRDFVLQIYQMVQVVKRGKGLPRKIIIIHNPRTKPVRRLVLHVLAMARR